MPKYKCHKVVHALKIKAIDASVITPEEDGFAPFTVSIDYMTKHQPQVGGYYVVYSGGYKSFSPAKEFDEGYTKV